MTTCACRRYAAAGWQTTCPACPTLEDRVTADADACLRLLIANQDQWGPTRDDVNLREGRRWTQRPITLVAIEDDER